MSRSPYAIRRCEAVFRNGHTLIRVYTRGKQAPSGAETVFGGQKSLAPYIPLVAKAIRGMDIRRQTDIDQRITEVAKREIPDKAIQRAVSLGFSSAVINAVANIYGVSLAEMLLARLNEKLPRNAYVYGSRTQVIVPIREGTPEILVIIPRKPPMRMPLLASRERISPLVEALVRHASTSAQEMLGICQRELEALKLERDVYLGLNPGAESAVLQHLPAFAYGFQGQRRRTSSELLTDYAALAQAFPLRLIVDPFAADDVASQKEIVRRLGGTTRIVTDYQGPAQLTVALEQRTANGIMFRFSRLGTISEYLDALAALRLDGWASIACLETGRTCSRPTEFALALLASRVKIPLSLLFSNGEGMKSLVARLT